MTPYPSVTPSLVLDQAAFGSILSQVSLSMEPGRLLAVIGPNGAGKSTLLRLLAGYLRPTSGRVMLGNHPTHKLPGRERGGLLGYLPQDVETSFPFTALEVAMMGVKALASEGSKGENEAMQGLAKLGVAGLRDRSFPTLSGGEQRLVLAAKMLVQRPRWLLLDEPTDALDWRNSRHLLGELQELARVGHGVICVLHDLNLVWQLGLDVLLLHQGRVLFHGPSGQLPLEVLSQAYGTPFTQLRHPVTGAPVLVEG